MSTETYCLYPVRHTPEFKGLWAQEAWGWAPVMEIGHFRPEGSDHRPRVQAKLLYDRDGIHGLFRVRDRYVRSVHTRFQDPVYEDSCVEFFVLPKGAAGYFNFEFNCGGALLASYIVDPTRTDTGFRDFTLLSEDDCRQVMIHHSMPRVVEAELVAETTWYLEFCVPLGLLETYAGPLRMKAGELWRANLYKCGDRTSHPHWAAWSPLRERNFHMPDCFGEIRFMAPEAFNVPLEPEKPGILEP
jgi:hypothetical protein